MIGLGFHEWASGARLHVTNVRAGNVSPGPPSDAATLRTSLHAATPNILPKVGWRMLALTLLPSLSLDPTLPH